MTSPITRKTLVLLYLLLTLLWSVACAESEESAASVADTATPIPATATPRPTATPTMTPSPVPPTATPTSTPTPAPLEPSAIFDRVAPSIAYIETAFGSGSAILIDGGYLVSNAHVVWPYDSVRAVFPDGSEYEQVPLVGWDLLLDLAVLGPLPDVNAGPLVLVDGEASVVGSDVYLVGYPGEVEAFPQPTITRGLISRQREWESAGITYFQTDATIAGGQSGGALVSEMGDVIGISGFTFAASEFGLVASAHDLTGRVQQLITGEKEFSHDDNIIDHEERKQEHSVYLESAWNRAAFIVAPGCDARLEVEARSTHDVVLQIVDTVTGDFWEADETLTGIEWLTASLLSDGLHLVSLYQLEEERAIVTLDSSCDLIPINDRDDQANLHIDESVRGAVDFPGDMDIFYLFLEKGEQVNLVIDAASIDPYIQVTYPHARLGQSVEDDDSGGGLFGLNADLTFLAPHSDRFLVIVGDATGTGIGGYSLVVSSDRADAPTPVPLPPTPTPVTTEYGPMQVYRSDRYSFTMQIPEVMEDVTEFDESCSGVCFTGNDVFLGIEEQDIEALTGDQGPTVTRQQFDALFRQSITSFLPGATLQSRYSMTTESGVPVEISHYRWVEGGFVYHFKMMVALEDGIGFTAFYVVPDELYGQFEPTIDYSFSTLALE